jgi:hypothetical protein
MVAPWGDLFLSEGGREHDYGHALTSAKKQEENSLPDNSA